MKKVLIVDDNIMMRKLIRNIFRNENIEILEAENGIAGLETIKNTAIDLVVTDLIMPRMEGIELIMHLKRDFPGIRIIAISGGKPYYLYMAKKMGIDGVFTKPLNLNKFLQMVKKLIQFPANDNINHALAM